MCRSPNLAKDDKLESENNDPGQDISGRHFLFDKKCKEFQNGSWGADLDLYISSLTGVLIIFDLRVELVLKVDTLGI